ncbi:MAG: M23 family metallopeptidase [Myxococcales bacterium]|nr:M23 family metallopeptidase [Myxococcales bacterium]MCB9702071.1 M23 family metallopeptidase [Myxococcales bacterium]
MSGSASSPGEPRGRAAARILALALAPAAAATACGEPPPAAEDAAREAAPTPSRPPAPIADDPLAELGLAPLRPLPRATWPTEIPHITSTFGWRQNPITGAGTKLHRGLDLRGQIGDPVMAIADGVVRFAGHDPFLGNCVIVDHGAGITSWYGHLSDHLTFTGMPVERGAAIGLVGNSGRSQAPHLHLTVKIGATAIDPLLLLGAPLHPYAALVGGDAAADEGEG